MDLRNNANVQRSKSVCATFWNCIRCHATILNRNAFFWGAPSKLAHFLLDSFFRFSSGPIRCCLSLTYASNRDVALVGLEHGSAKSGSRNKLCLLCFFFRSFVPSIQSSRPETWKLQTNKIWDNFLEKVQTSFYRSNVTAVTVKWIGHVFLNFPIIGNGSLFAHF